MTLAVPYTPYLLRVFRPSSRKAQHATGNARPLLPASPGRVCLLRAALSRAGIRPGYTWRC
jgi:hypothetical protein